MKDNINLRDTSRPAAGQTIRLPGADRSAAVHEQLYRYAEDLQEMIEQHGKLESRCEALRESCDRLMENRAQLDELMRSSLDIHIITDAGGTILQINPAGTALAPTLLLTGCLLQDRVLSSHTANFIALQAAALEGGGEGGQARELHLRREPADAPLLVVSAQALPVRRDGRASQLHWILRDVTHQREAEFETQVSSMVFKSAAEGVMITDVEGEIIAVNPAFCTITGYAMDEVIGRTPRILNSGLQDAAFYADFWRALRSTGSWQGEVFNRKKNGEIYPEWLTVNAARDADGRVISYIAVFSDLSRLLQAEKRLSYLAHHDTLTALPNRLLFQDRLGQLLSQARRSGVQFSVVFIDLDHFKPINDTLGHAIGDSVLQEAASRLADSVRECDTVARLGGDEFVILAPGLVGDTDIGRFCTKVIEALGRPIQLEGHEIHISGSLGCAEYPNHGDDEAALLKCADAAMYQAKAAGGSRHVIYSQGVTGAASDGKTQ